MDTTSSVQTRRDISRY